MTFSELKEEGLCCQMEQRPSSFNILTITRKNQRSSNTLFVPYSVWLFGHGQNQLAAFEQLLMGQKRPV